MKDIIFGISITFSSNICSSRKDRRAPPVVRTAWTTTSWPSSRWTAASTSWTAGRQAPSARVLPALKLSWRYALKDFCEGEGKSKFQVSFYDSRQGGGAHWGSGAVQCTQGLERCTQDLEWLRGTKMWFNYRNPSNEKIWKMWAYCFILLLTLRTPRVHARSTCAGTPRTSTSPSSPSPRRWTKLWSQLSPPSLLLLIAQGDRDVMLYCRNGDTWYLFMYFALTPSYLFQKNGNLQNNVNKRRNILLSACCM